jgi:hypothetical protein
MKNKVQVQDYKFFEGIAKRFANIKSEDGSALNITLISALRDNKITPLEFNSLVRTYHLERNKLNEK